MGCCSKPPLYRAFHSGGHGGRRPPLNLNFFSKTPYQNQCHPMGCTPHLKLKPAHLKNKPPSPTLKSEAPFHEMIPRKSTINNNLQVFSWQLYYQMNSYTSIFRQHFKSPHAPHVLNTCGKPCCGVQGATPLTACQLINLCNNLLPSLA